MSRARVLAALAVASFALAACGGEDGGGVGGGASVAPSSSALYLTVNTDFEGDQWQTAELLIEKFPGGRAALASFLSELEEDEDLDFETDVKPAVGPEVAFVLLDFEGENFVVLTQPEDPAKFRRIVEEGDDPGVTEEIEGWWAGAPTQAVLDRFKQARDSGVLEDDDSFQAAMEDLPGESLVSGYVNAAEIEKAAPAQSAALSECFSGQEEASSFAFAVGAEDDGVRLTGSARAEGLEDPGGGVGEHADNLPAEGLLAYVALHGLGEQLREVLRCASDADENFARQLAQAELVLGLSIDEDILTHFEEETAVVVYEGRPLPTVALVTQVEDEANALEAADQIAARADAFFEELEVEDVDVDGVAAKRVAMGDTEIFYAVADGVLVVSLSDRGISAALAPDGDPISSDADFSAAREAAEAPDEPQALAYVDVAASLEYAFGLFVPAGSPDPQLEANLEPLRSLLLWSDVEGDLAEFRGFLQID